jgi:hypothetical protein
MRQEITNFGLSLMMNLKALLDAVKGPTLGSCFRDMQSKANYEDQWKIASTAEGIRSAKKHEVKEWLAGHSDDAKFAEPF